MAVMVHAEGRDAITRPKPEPLERLAHAPGVVRQPLPVRPHNRAVGPRRDDLAVAVLALGMVRKDELQLIAGYLGRGGTRGS